MATRTRDILNAIKVLVDDMVTNDTNTPGTIDKHGENQQYLERAFHQLKVPAINSGVDASLTE